MIAMSSFGWPEPGRYAKLCLGPPTNPLSWSSIEQGFGYARVCDIKFTAQLLVNVQCMTSQYLEELRALDVRRARLVREGLFSTR